MPKSIKALAIRPYANRVKELVFHAFDEAGIALESPQELREATNRQVIDALQSLRANMLLIPFNVQRLDGEQRTNGLELLESIRREVAWTQRTPAVMPVSVFANVAYEAQAAKHPDPYRLAIFEDELEHADLPGRLASFAIS